MHINGLAHSGVGGQAAGPVGAAVVAADNQTAGGAGLPLLGGSLRLHLVDSLDAVGNGLRHAAVGLDADVHHRTAGLADGLGHLLGIGLLAAQGQQHHTEGIGVGTGGDEALQCPGKPVRELAAGSVHKGGGHIAGRADPLHRVVGALDQGDHQHLVADAEGAVSPLVTHNGFRQVQFLFCVDPGIGIIQGVRSHGTVVGPLIPVDLLKIVVDIFLVDPIALLDVLGRDADMDAVFQDLTTLGNIHPGDLMAFLDKLVGSQLLPGYHGVIASLNGLNGNGYVVVGFDQHGLFAVFHLLFLSSKDLIGCLRRFAFEKAANTFRIPPAPPLSEKRRRLPSSRPSAGGAGRQDTYRIKVSQRTQTPTSEAPWLSR